jgi:Zinc carboxypeptidase
MLVTSILLFAFSSTALATPVATSDEAYSAFGRVFPDPHACVKGAPGTSPWAKGQVCAVQYLQWNEAIDGLGFLEQRFDRYVDVLSGEELRRVARSLTDEELRSAGLPQEDLSRTHRDLHVVKITDSRSRVPEAKRKHFAYSLSIHGIERAGVEGGVRAIEDLVTWAACERDPEAAPACATEGPFPKRILEPSNSGPTAGAVLRRGVVFFVLSNPDGWHRGEWSQGGVFFQRYNGNGMDINRDWASVGYTEQQYTPFSEPETRGYAKFLRAVRAGTNARRFEGAIDLHGMLTARAFSFTLLGAGQRDLRKNELSVDTSILTFRDSEKRLSWSPLIAPAGDCPGPIHEPAFGGDAPMCSDQWGTVWDTINYQVTGSFGDWMDSPIGLDAVGIDNEMALSHIAPNTVFEPGVEQLHIDGNKGLVYSQIAALLPQRTTSFEPKGKVAYIFDRRRIRHRGGGTPRHGQGDLPAQQGFEQTEVGGQGFSFDVKGPSEGVHNGGLTIEATYGNVQGISPNAAATLILDYCGPGEHPGDPDGECREVARYFNQSPTYVQAGARIDLNDPRPGPYRIRADETRVLPTRYDVRFSQGSAHPTPKQAPFNVSRMDFFKDVNRYIPRQRSRLKAVRVRDVLDSARALRGFDTVFVANDFMPGRHSKAKSELYARRLAAFARGGGNLVLTDGAIAALPALGAGVPADKIRTGSFYAGWADFDDGRGPTYRRHRLAKGVNKEGTAEGQGEVDGQTFDNRHQTYEPVPLGYYVSPEGSGNAACDSDRCDSPNWIVDQDAWKAAGGTTAGRTLVRETTEPGSPSHTGTSLGELKFGDGVSRIAGALLPNPTTKNYHPYGLFSYALTYTGYQLFENLIAYRRP